jgi:hypothetical protein
MGSFMLDVVAIQRAWNKMTSATPEQWSPRNRARGQCAVTALLVQDCIGGILVRTMATLPDGTSESHYATMDDVSGVIFDLTEVQFPEGTTFGPWESREREYVLSFDPTAERYQLLLQRVNEVQTIERVQIIGGMRDEGGAAE